MDDPKPPAVSLLHSKLGERRIGVDMPVQRFKPILPVAEIKAGLAELSPQNEWCHYFDLGKAGQTVGPEAGLYFDKAIALKLIAEQVVQAVPFITARGTVEGLSVLDLASAEGQHSIELAMAGACTVVGVDGRQIHVDRASFMARTFGAANARFQKGDVRKISPEKIGRYELVLFFGILHHLAPDDFFPMLKLLRALSSDTVLIYTHTLASAANARFGDSLGPQMRTRDGYQGRPFREHAEQMTMEEREKRLRSSLDNTFSFWTQETELLRALRNAGFRYVARQLAPNPFPDPVNEFRVLYVCRV